MPARDIRYHLAIDDEIDEQLTQELSQLEVVETVRGEATFKIRFQVDICKGDYELLNDERLIPGKDRRLTVMVTVDGERFCLINGLVSERKPELKEGGAGSSLEISGKDRRIEMGRNADERRPLTGTSSLIVTPILAQYFPFMDVEHGDTQLYSEATNTRNQPSSDLELVSKLASESAYEFWVDAEVLRVLGNRIFLKETAHFRSSPSRGQGPIRVPSIIAPTGAPKLVLNPANGCSTLLMFTSERSSERPTASGNLARVDLDTGDLQNTEVSAPSLEAFGAAPPAAKNRRPVVSPGNAADARRRQDAALIDASWVINARAETTVHALGQLVRPHQTVKVQGTGAVDDGDYFVWKVTHNIDAADHKMSLELRRNGVGA